MIRDSECYRDDRQNCSGLANSFELMGRTPENVDKFNAAMTELTRLVTPDILRSYDFSGISHLMDVGGGSGELLGAVAQQNRKLRGTVFDLPRCADAASRHLRQIGISDRVEFVAGDFFKSVPAIADAIILKSVIHDWNDARSISILQNCHQALPKGGKLLLVERLMPEAPDANDEDKAHALSDLNMLRGPAVRAQAGAVPRIARAKRLRSGCGLSSRPLQRDRGASRLTTAERARTVTQHQATQP